MRFFDELRRCIGVGMALKGGLCPKCRSGSVLLTTLDGLLALQCENCSWRKRERPRPRPAESGS